MPDDMAVADATYIRKTEGGKMDAPWYDVMIHETKVGEVFKTKKGWFGHCQNAKKRPVGPAKSKEALGQTIVGAWEKFPHEG